MAKFGLIIVAFFLLLFFSVCYKPVNAQESSPIQAEITTVVISEAAANKGTITGAIEIQTPANKGLDNASLVIKLLEPGKTIEDTFNGQKRSRTAEALLIDYQTIDNLDISTGQKLDQSFTLKYPLMINSGNYLLTAELLDQDLSSQGIGNKSLALNGNGGFLQIDPAKCNIKVGSINFGPAEGATIQKNQTGIASCLVKNPNVTRVEAKISLPYAPFSVAQNAGQIKKLDVPDQVISFEPNQEKNITFTLPGNLTPTVYEALLQLNDPFGEKISVNIPFRWIVGGASATIQNLDLDKSYYKKGETSKISATFLASADMGWRADLENPFSPTAGTDIEGAKASISVKNQKGELCGEKTENLPSTKGKSWDAFVFEVPIDNNCYNPSAEIQILDANGQTLTQFKKDYTSTDADLKSAGVVRPMGNNILWVTGGIALLLAVSGAIFIYLRRRKKSPPPPPVSPPNPPSDAGHPLTSTTAAKISLMMIIITAGIVGVIKPDLKLSFNFLNEVLAQQAIIKQPINSADANVRNVSLQTTGSGRNYWSSHHQVWGNARDFAQNNTGGDSQIVVEPDCSKINITIRASAASNFTCGNWGDGLLVSPYIDGQPVKPQNVTSPIGNEIWNPSVTDNSFDLLQFNSLQSQREGMFSVIPSEASRFGNHRLTLRVGTTLAVRHSSIDLYMNTFENNTNCDGNGPCYIEMNYDFACKPPPACNDNCTTNNDCKFNPDGCTECRPASGGTASGSATAMTCQTPPPPACNSICATSNDCTKNTEGCTQCVAGQCRMPPACNVSCGNDQHCAQATDGCNKCLPNPNGAGSSCQPPIPVCGDSCTSDTQCTRAKDGCTACVPNATGTGSSCAPPPACNVSCVNDKQCAGSKDGCIQCAPNTAGKNVCQPTFNEAMCKCDGFNALNISNPSKGNFQFEAFAKVEKGDVRAAQVKDMKFTLYKSSKSNPDQNVTPVASGTIIPQIVSSTADKVRYRALWNVAPPAFDPNAVYRVGAEPTCIRKPISATASASLLNFSSAVALLSSDNAKVLGTELNYTPAKLVQSNNLELGTLEDGFFTRIVETDSCRFIRFEYGQY